MKRKFLTLIAAVAAAMALALSAGAEAATPETAGSLTPLMPMFDTADTGIAEYSGDIVQEDAATYNASYNANEDVAANERDVYNYLTGTMGMNSAAASGVMASMYRESRFYVDITNDYGTAYGLVPVVRRPLDQFAELLQQQRPGLAYPVRPDALFGI